MEGMRMGVMVAMVVMVGWVSMGPDALVVAQQALNQTCLGTLTPLLPCVPYIEDNNTTAPGPNCCDPLATLLASNESAPCFCQVSNISTDTVVNFTLVLNLPSACNLTVPDSVESCLNSSLVPTFNATSPALSPLPTPSGTPGSSNATTSPPQTGVGLGNRGSRPSSPFSALLICFLSTIVSLAI